MKKINNIKIVIAIIIVVTFGLLFAWKSYVNSPARNPNNPLANINLKIVDVNGEAEFTETTSTEIDKSLLTIMLKKKDNNSEIFNYLKNMKVSSFDNMTFVQIRDNTAEKAINNQETIVNDKFTELLKNDDRAQDVINDLHYMLEDDEEANVYQVIEPNKNVKIGQKVQVKLAIPDDLISEYGLNVSPRTIQIQEGKQES
ncbi:hypothetical protein GCM10022297_17270 [Lactobacillus hamsteri]|uniref:Uncharacterized protein n=1 Tax=Lactobacillus hamsteri DSM 5661 = JCM 6256 TaxID=1423754 RepID=A0A0R1YH63_9LACO|nr:hypothetical protein [Lactobacillus hamsteri]KRM38467.1 hypothetical protein FC39_GL001279 [Lactobacillus hamsteri DSM 5661 = JCM 6256]